MLANIQPQPIQTTPPTRVEDLTIKLIPGLINLNTEVFAILLVLAIYKALLEPIQQKILSWLNNPKRYDANVMVILAQILATSKADRVILGSFHNGEKFSNGVCMKFLSFSHEVTLPKTSGIAQHFQRILLSRISLEMEIYRHSTNNLFVPIRRGQPDIKGDCEKHLNRIGVHTMLNRLISKDSIELGIVSIQYCDKVLTDDEIREVEESCYNLILAVDSLVSRREISVGNLFHKVFGFKVF